VIRLRVPGALQYRDLTVRCVAAACKLVGAGDHGSGPIRLNREFDDQVVSAFSEAFNNAAIHSYHGQPGGELEIEIELGDDSITIRLLDYGASFDLADVPEPDLDSLPESGLGIFIIKSFMDEVKYEAGAPNVLSMTKSIKSASRAGGGA
jgi:serine/threonine-protein kinase RsbW